MNSGELLSIEPLELKFLFEPKKQMSCSLKLSNKTSNHVAFKVKITNPKSYCVRPKCGIIQPWSTSDVIVTMQAQKQTPNMECKDKFLIQSIIACPCTKTEDILFDKKFGHAVEEIKLKVLFDTLPQPPSTVDEQLHQDSSPTNSKPNNDALNIAEVSARKSRSFLQVMLRKTKSANKNTKIQTELCKPLLGEYHDKPELNALKNAYKDASTKIQIEEAALKDTRLVLQDLGRRIEDMSN